MEQDIKVLNEVTIYSLNLKEKLKGIKKNIKHFYEIKPVHYYGTYKEKFSTNDSLNRLFQIQFEWYKKNGVIHDYNNVFHKQNQIKINSIDYSRILNDTILENGGFVPNSYLFELLSINYYLNFILEYAENISIMSVKKTDNIVEVTFDCNIVVKGNIVSSLRNSVIFFDSKMEYIDKIKLDIIYHNQIHKGISEKTKTPYKTSINNHRLYIQFGKIDRNRKYTLNIFKTEFVGVGSYNNLSFTFKSRQEFLITSSLRKGKSMSSIDKIDLENPFYDSVKEKNFKIYGVKFPLTQQELIFLNE